MSDLDHTIYGASPSDAKANLILLHGFGHTAEIAYQAMKGAIPDDVRVFALHGPVPVGSPSERGCAWFEITPGEAGPPQPNLAQESTSRAAIANFFNTCDANLPLIVMGFGQGGVMASHLYLEHPEKMQLCVLGSARIMPHLLEQYPPGAQHNAVPVVWTHGKNDPVLHFADAQATADKLKRDGVPLTWLPHEGGHEWPSIADRVAASEIMKTTGKEK
ncbi:hypothetical protein HY29_03440 [Hyphomonas beringensis]|uniref:Phospholipase/carboxylesterase/thioesterase domain-containing protein n=1 Tax=Hyphomonas beringensis TaxID=1280946 RepID=A0A062U6A8_9PROT|nr:hypothetical protein [Hyphomonas beringensis]KCZ53283.1 hypothetical protein HY29_03440 [Hyphomonas beringensis]